MSLEEGRSGMTEQAKNAMHGQVHESQMNEGKGAMCPNPRMRMPESSLPLY